MNPHDKNYLPREASFMWGRLFATLLFGAVCFMVGYLCAEVRMKSDPPPCKPVVIQKQSQSEYPISKAQIARFIRQFHNQDAGWIR